MHPSQFDTLVKTLGSRASRRAMLVALAGRRLTPHGAGAGLALWLGLAADPAVADCQRQCREKDHGAQRRCRERCRGNDDGEHVGGGPGCEVLNPAVCRRVGPNNHFRCTGDLSNVTVGPDCLLDGTVFLGANLTNTVFNGVRMQVAGFTVDSTRGRDTILNGTQFVGTYLVAASFAYQTLIRVNLTNANLAVADLTGVEWYETVCPDGSTTSSTCCGHLNGAQFVRGC